MTPAHFRPGSGLTGGPLLPVGKISFPAATFL
jgi:hypothetical protein